MVEDRIYVQVPKRHHYECFVLKRSTPGNPIITSNYLDTTGIEHATIRHILLSWCNIPSHQTLEYLKRLRYSRVWLDGISHHNREHSTLYVWSRKQESLDGWCNTSVLHPTEISELSHYQGIGQLSRDRLEHKEHRRQSLTASFFKIKYNIFWILSSRNDFLREWKYIIFGVT